MAKRLTDTDKWKDEWYSNLSNDYKIIWQWLLDNCDHAGICKKNMRLLNFMCNTSVKEEEIIEVMEGRVVSVKDNWFIPNFLKFQYKTLTSKKPVIVSVVNRLLETNCYTMIPKSFGNDYLIIKDKDKDKDIVNDKDIDEKNTKQGKKSNSDFANQYRETRTQIEKGIKVLRANNLRSDEDNLLHLLSTFTEMQDHNGLAKNNFNEFSSHFCNWIGASGVKYSLKKKAW